MMIYKAMDETGKLARGRIDAVNVADLEARLRRMGLDLVNYNEARVKGSSSGRTVQRRELIDFCFQLEQLISSGVPLLEALPDLRDSMERRQMREVIAGMIESIEGGKTLSGAMEEVPSLFDNVFVNLVRAGEMSGQIGTVLLSITENLKWQDEQAAMAKRLLTYPIITLVVVLGVIVFLMTYLVPQLVNFVTSMGQELPRHTAYLIAVSNFMVGNWYWLVPAPFVIWIGVSVLARVNASVRYFVDDLKLRGWIVGPIIKKTILGRFANYFALMYESGIPVLECVRICERLVDNEVIERAARRAGRHISEGASISAGFEYTGLFPPLVLRMLKVGENTGALDKSLRNISYFYDRDVRESMERLQTMMGPALTGVLGLILLWVIISVLGPVYDLITKLDF
ncbi:MAG: type II secretion system F family protein [Gammaproteobacteria bacterium]